MCVMCAVSVHVCGSKCYVSVWMFEGFSRRQSLLDEPNPNSPANSMAAQLYQENRREYEKAVLKCVEESWRDTDAAAADAAAGAAGGAGAGAGGAAAAAPP